VSRSGEVEQALAAITTALNDHGLTEWDRGRVQDIVIEACDGEPALEVDDGGGLHDSAGARVGAVRRTPSGEWITERQNPAAERSDIAIPAPGPRSKLRSVLSKLKIKS
jgi:hypothetical protein